MTEPCAHVPQTVVESPHLLVYRTACKLCGITVSFLSAPATGDGSAVALQNPR